jgi:hypothetical protein
MNTLISPLQREAIAEGERHHYRFTAVTEGNYKVGWVYERVTKAPEIASSRIKTLETARIRVCEILIAHEAPRVLPAPKVETKKSDFKIAPILPDLETFIGFAVQAFILFGSLFFQLLLLDPAIVVVLEDGTWLEVCNYYE